MKTLITKMYKWSKQFNQDNFLSDREVHLKFTKSVLKNCRGLASSLCCFKSLSPMVSMKLTKKSWRISKCRYYKFIFHVTESSQIWITRGPFSSPATWQKFNGYKENYIHMALLNYLQLRIIKVSLEKQTYAILYILFNSVWITYIRKTNTYPVRIWLNFIGQSASAKVTAYYIFLKVKLNTNMNNFFKSCAKWMASTRRMFSILINLHGYCYWRWVCRDWLSLQVVFVTGWSQYKYC